MRRGVVATLLVGMMVAGSASASGQGVLDRMKQKAKDKLNQQADQQVDQQTDAAPKNAAKPDAEPQASAAKPADDSAAAAPAGAPSIRSYQNYDFVPGESILFADDFTATQDGEFPAQWELAAGQAVVNRMGGFPALLLTDGNYAVVKPRMSGVTYLPSEFTLECDVYAVPGAYPLHVELLQGDDTAQVYAGGSEAAFEGAEVQLRASLPPALRDEAFDGKWHHIAVVYRKPQLKLYVDQYRVLSVPDTKMVPESMAMAGIGDQEKPIVFRNVRLAGGGGMNMVGKTMTTAKIVTHGINFDVDKATLRPESMGVLNQIKSLMASDAALKFEIDGHTDGSGTPAHNMTLSQQRAEAVKTQLVSMGVEAGRLTTKGYGNTKPLGPDGTPAEKANNRRVEFVRMS